MKTRTVAEIKAHVKLLIEFNQHLEDKINLNQASSLTGLTDLAQLKFEYRAIAAELTELLDYIDGKGNPFEIETMERILSEQQ